LNRGSGAAPTVALAVAWLSACEPIATQPVNDAPINACPAHPCETYKQGTPAPTCSEGVCTVATPTTGLLLVIELAGDTYLAPGRTYLMSFGDQPAAGPCALLNCAPLSSCQLTRWTVDDSFYLIDLQAATSAWANYYLGNPDQATALPVNATYRPLLGFPAQDAIDLGLPLQPVQAINVQNPGPIPPGPNGTEALEFEAYMQPGCYERTLQPYAPFSKAFPPEIKPWPPSSGVEGASISEFDTTSETSETNASKTVPRFSITRAEGLDGWTAYLRDSQTKRVFSNVAPLSGSLAANVTLLTNHVVILGGEALTNLELVIAPPDGAQLPTEFIAPLGPPGAQVLPASEAYPSLPTPVTMSGRIRTAAGAPVAADVTFTATGITGRTGMALPKNFEFVTTVSTDRDPQSGAETYTALLPQGDYQVSVRPTDSTSAVTVVSRSAGGQGNVMTGEDIDVAPLVAVQGTAMVTDGRQLAQAIVEALPTQCPPVPTATPVASATAVNPCLPRSAQTITRDDGTYALALDPGVYTLRARPVDGSRLPWVAQTLTVGSGPMTVPIKIPAPISAGMTLHDSNNNAITNAIVRVFTTPTPGVPPVELGQAITGVDGSYEMFLAPPSQ
jgi:hypothetical protein